MTAGKRQRVRHPKGYIDECFEIFSNDNILQTTRTAEVAERFGVSAATVSRFRKRLGLPPWHPTINIDNTPILQYPDFGLLSGKARASHEELGRIFKVSQWYIRKLMLEYGIEPSFRPQGGRKMKLRQSILSEWKRNPELNNIPRRKLRAKW